ncbi:MAG: DUF817 domain-containing protein [Leptospirales bacterium]|nr:DUF817 domain-containing protein [Leptospirales bacterium]
MPPVSVFRAAFVVPWPELWRDALASIWLEARSCIFAGSFFVLLYAVGKLPAMGIARYDLIFVGAVLIQATLIVLRLETRDELLTLGVFHLLGFALEVFKTHPAIGSWSYPGEGRIKVLNVPLYSGFMYAAVASYIVQVFRLLRMRLAHAPNYALSALLGVLIYINFFTHHFFVDLRWWLTVATLLLFARTSVIVRPRQREYSMPATLGFLLVGVAIWFAENISTLLGAWSYPHQHQGWKVVGLGKISSWSLLVIVSFLLVAGLRHWKERRGARI